MTKFEIWFNDNKGHKTSKDAWEACKQEILIILNKNIRCSNEGYGNNYEFIDFNVITEIEKL